MVCWRVVVLLLVVFLAYGFGLFNANGADFNRQISFGHSTRVSLTESVVKIPWRQDYVREYLFAQREYLRHKCPVSDEELVSNGFFMTEREKKCVQELREELNKFSSTTPYPCVIIESVQSSAKGALGILFARALAEVCLETKTPVVIDCIMTAVRVGAAMVCFEFLGFSPDVVVVGKAIPGASVLLVHHKTGVDGQVRPRLLLASKPLPPSPNTTIQITQHQYDSILYRMSRYSADGFLENIVDRGEQLRNAMVGDCLFCMENTSKCPLGVGLLVCANKVMIRKSVSFTHDRLLPKLDITSQIIHQYIAPSSECQHHERSTRKRRRG